MGKRILIVEDEGLLAYELAQQLAISGFEIMGTALSTRQAIAMIDKQYKDHPERWSRFLGDEIIAALTVSGGPCEGAGPATEANVRRAPTVGSVLRVR